MLVHTTKGDIEFDKLDIRDLVSLGKNYRKIVTEYRLDGELVRNDVVVNVLMPFDVLAEHGVING